MFDFPIRVEAISILPVLHKHLSPVPVIPKKVAWPLVQLVAVPKLQPLTIPETVPPATVK